jgi:hypothetical protein
MPNTVISFPVPAYQNLPIEPQYYAPSQFFISGISLGILTIVTTSVNHNYSIGQLVRLLVPNGFGTRQLNEMLGYVTSIPALNQVMVNIDSSRFDPFFLNTVIATQPQIVAVGDVNTGTINTNGNTLEILTIPGSFTNIS